MTTLRVDGTLLASDAGARTLTYRLLPFREPGRTSAGLVTVEPGVVELPAPDAVVLNLEHDPHTPVGRGVSLEETADALVATFRILPTRAGDDLLVEAAERVRAGASVELDGITIRSGRLTAGRLTGAGAVVTPAFPSALLVASDTEPEPELEPEPDPVDDPVVDDTDPDAPASAEPEEDPMTVNPAAAPATLHAAATPSAPAPMTLSRVSSLLAAVSRGDRSPELLAALSDITQTAASEVAAPQFIGEVWSAANAERQIVPLLMPGMLSSYKVTGWKWATPPNGATYAGDKAAVPSNAAATAPVEYDALRWAGAHDVDRKFVDFGDASFWSSYWEAMAASYATWSDTAAVTGIIAGATAVVPDGTGVVAAIVKAALAVIPHGTPSYALLGSAAFAELVERDPLAFLSGSVSLSSGDGNVGGLAFRTHPSLAAAQVVVGTRRAATWYELGSTPIRVEAVNIANGGVDVGAFGYGVLGVHSGTGIAKTTVTAPTP